MLQQLVPLTPVPIGILTGYGDSQTAVAAMKLGAADYREKRLLDDDVAGFILELVERGPRDAPQLAESEWISVHLARLSPSMNRDEILRILLSVLSSRRVCLRFHVVIAEGLRVAQGGCGATAILTIRERFNRARSEPWPTHPALLVCLAELEGDAIKQPQRAFARRIPLSRSYFSHRMTRETGHSPAYWCRAAVLRHGLRLLLESGEPVSQVAYACGYQHHSQFDREFSSMYGTAPRDLRVVHRGAARMSERHGVRQRDRGAAAATSARRAPAPRPRLQW